jgi:ribonuclease VapC
LGLRLCIDTSAVVAIIEAEPDAVTLAAKILLFEGVAAISAASLVEAGIVLQARRGTPLATELEAFLATFRITVEPVSDAIWPLAIEAYRRFGRGSGSPARLNFGDCFTYALARHLQAPVLFKGDDFTHTDLVAA